MSSLTRVMFFPRLRSLRPFTRSFASPSASKDETIKWLWEADPREVTTAIGHTYSSRIPGCLNTLNTKEPLDPETVHKALVHLQRQSQAFRGVLKEKDGKFWICESNQDTVNFQVHESGDVTEMYRYFETPIAYDQAPLWRAIFLPGSPTDPCHLQEIKSQFPFQNHLAIQVHHTFVGGPTMPMITQRLVEILNDVIAGRPIDDSRQIGALAPSIEIDAAKRRIREELEKDPERLEALMKEIEVCDTEPMMLKAFPKPGGDPSTAYILRDVSHEVYSRFTAKSKAEGVTFNSALQAVINSALVEAATEVGLREEVFNITINLATDLRRYMAKKPLKVHGLHVCPTVHQVRTPKHVRNHFWQYARELHGALTPRVKAGLALQQEVVREMTQPAVDPHEYFRSGPPVVRDYGLASIGDLTFLLKGEGDHLQLTDTQTMTTVTRMNYMNLHQIFTFRGRCHYSLSYNTAYMTHDTANMLVERVFAMLEDVTN